MSKNTYCRSKKNRTSKGVLLSNCCLHKPMYGRSGAFLWSIKIIMGLTLLNVLSGCALLFSPKIDGETAYEKKQYTQAAGLFEDEYKNTGNLEQKSHIATKIAECYRMANRTEQAEQWYKSALDFSADPQVNFKYALMLKANGKYNEAISLFKEYVLSQPSDRARGAEQVQACRQAMEWQKKPTLHRLENLQGLNSTASDFSPILYDGQMVFTSDRPTATGDKKYGWTGEKHSDLFVSSAAKDGFFYNPVLFGDSVNTEYNEGTATFTGDGRVMYFTACGSEGEKDDFCQIYTTYKDKNGKWQLPEKVKLFDTDTINVGQPYITSDGTQLYFSANAPGGFGQKDIYRVQLTKERKWSEPQNMGPEINTSGYEGFPYIGPDGRLYFASDGHLGMGGLDIFVATPKNDQWENAQNLQYPINSAADDFGLYLEPYLKPEWIDSIESVGYFASSRKGGKGSDDIYKMVLSITKQVPPDTPEVVVVPPPTGQPKIVYWLEGRVWQKTFAVADDPNSGIKGSTPITNAIVQVLGLSVDSKISKRFVTDAQGRFALAVEEDTDYRLTASQAGFFAKTDIVSTKGRKPNITTTRQLDTVKIRADITLDKIYKSKEIVLENIYYDLDKANIRDDAKPTLNKLAQLLRENPQIKIELGSHTDSRGSDAYNMRLSQARAEAAVNYLVSEGITIQRLSARGYGESQLVNRCRNGIECSEEEHQQNRRTTFKVVADNYSGGE